MEIEIKMLEFDIYCHHLQMDGKFQVLKELHGDQK